MVFLYPTPTIGRVIPLPPAVVYFLVVSLWENKGREVMETRTRVGLQENCGPYSGELAIFAIVFDTLSMDKRPQIE